MLQNVYVMSLRQLHGRKEYDICDGTGLRFHAIAIPLRFDKEMNEAEIDAQDDTGRRPSLINNEPGKEAGRWRRVVRKTEGEEDAK